MTATTVFNTFQNFYRKNLLRIVGACLCLLFMLYFSFRSDLIWAIFSFNLAIQCLCLGLEPKKQHEPYLTTDIFSQLKCEQGVIYIREQQLSINKVKKVALDKLDEKYAFIDFPFNIYRAAAVRFPLSQLPEIHLWLQQHLPDAEIIS